MRAMREVVARGGKRAEQSGASPGRCGTRRDADRSAAFHQIVWFGLATV